MGRWVALALCCAASGASAQDAELAGLLQSLVSTPERPLQVTVDTCQITLVEREEETWDGVVFVFEATQTFSLADHETSPDKAHLSGRPERDDAGRLAFPLAYDLTETARNAYGVGFRVISDDMMEDLPGFGEIMWMVFTGNDTAFTDGQPTKKLALEGAYGPVIARNWGEESWSEDGEVVDVSFTPGGPAYIDLHGAQSAREDLVARLHAHRQTHCPDG